MTTCAEDGARNAYVLNEELEMLIAALEQVDGHRVRLLVVALLRFDDAREERVEDTRGDLVRFVEQRTEQVEQERLDLGGGLVTGEKGRLEKSFNDAEMRF